LYWNFICHLPYKLFYRNIKFSLNRQFGNTSPPSSTSLVLGMSSWPIITHFISLFQYLEYSYMPFLFNTGIRDYIISKSKCVCGVSNVLADDLLPNKTLRDTINRILESGNSSAENVGSAFQVQGLCMCLFCISCINFLLIQLYAWLISF
jgi:hypothetical protein